MFKKPLQDLKTSAPLRNSDRKKFRQKVVQQFSIEQLASGPGSNQNPNSTSSGEGDVNLGDILVPEGILSVKFRSHTDEAGIIYLSPKPPYDPLFFTFGKAKDDEFIIPTGKSSASSAPVYTLWKCPHLIPTISTPQAVIPKLTGGADLMAPGVITYPPDLESSQIVSISAYITPSTPSSVDTTTSSGVRLSYPLAVGSMVIPSSSLTNTSKGKVVDVLHAYGDHLWSIGGKREPPSEGLPFGRAGSDVGKDENQGDDKAAEADTEAQTIEKLASEVVDRTDDFEGRDDLREDVSAILRTSALQALSSSLSSLPKSSFPISASQLYTSHLLPSRPAYIPSSLSSTEEATTPVDIKHSSFKTLTSFLKSLEKEGLIKTKDIRGELHLTSFDTTHSALAEHQPYKTVGEADKKAAKKEAKEKEEAVKSGKAAGAIDVVECWKPQGTNVKFFEECKLSTSKSYTHSEVRAALQTYINLNKDQLIDPRKQHLIKLDPILASVVLSKDEWIDNLKREDILDRLIRGMQPWYQIKFPGEEVSSPKKGSPPVIKIDVKMRQGRKACTLTTGLEAWKIDPAALADELRIKCASSTSVSDLPGKNAGKEVLVQGKQVKIVLELLEAKGISKRWIQS
ncbi:hypothetical protein SISNIDRAFT_387553, partial [Sistotremastrum niveocremeum HHB9708]